MRKEKRSPSAIQRREKIKMERRKRERQQNHVYWESICAICGEDFTHDRMTAVYCSQKCRNKSRAFSQRFLDGLIKRSIQSLRSFKRTSVEEQAYIRNTSTLNESLDMMRASGIPENHIKDVLDWANQQKAKRKLQNITKEANKNDSLETQDFSSPLIDEEMANFKLPDIPLDIAMDDEVRDNLKFINKQDPLGNADGFGVGVVGSREQGEEQKKEENK